MCMPAIVHHEGDTGIPELEHDHLRVILRRPTRCNGAAFYVHVDAYGEYRECGVSEPQFSEDILRRAKRQGITSRAFRYLVLISAGIK